MSLYRFYRYNSRLNRNLPLRLSISFLLFLLISLTSFQSQGQQMQSEIKFKTLTSKEGMSSSNSRCLAQDQHGLIWIGTNNGLNVYNGYEFKHYFHGETGGNYLAHNFITALFFDNQNRLWVGSHQGIDLYDPELDSFTYYSPSNDQRTAGYTITWFYQDQQNTLFAGTMQGLNFFNEVTGAFELHNLPDQLNIEGRITAMLQDKSGQYWVGTEEGLYRYDPNKPSYTLYTQDKNTSEAITDNHINTLFEDSKGMIWIGTKAGLNQYLGEGNGFRHFKYNRLDYNSLSFNFINCIEEDLKGNLWVGTSEGGLNKFDPTSKTFERFLRDEKDPYSLADNSVKDIMVDKSGALWVTGFRGLNHQSPYQLQFDNLVYKAYDDGSLRDNFITALFKDSQGYIWAGNRLGISSFDPRSKTFTHYTHQPGDPTSIADGAVLNLTEDAEGNIWSLTHTKVLNKLNRKRKTFDRYAADPMDENSLQEESKFVLTTRDENVWACFRNGISQYDRENNSFNHFYIPDSILKGEPLYMYEDRQDNFLVITKDEVYVFDRKKMQFAYSDLIPKQYMPFRVNQIYEDRNDNFWIGSTHQGLLFRNPKENITKQYKLKEDLPEMSILGILRDQQGRIWLSSNKGLCRLDLQTGEYSLYTLPDGLPHTEFNLRAAVQAADGKMYFGGNQGISVFHPDKILKNPHPPKLVFTNFELFNQPVAIGEEAPLKKAIRETNKIELDYKQSVLSFEFAALNYNSSEKNQYAYRMLGFEEDWNYSGTRRHVTYTNLAPGRTYTFQVKASNNDGVWNEDGESIELYIHPPFWATWWFNSLLLVFALAIIYGLYRWRTRQHYFQRKMLEEMVRERTVEVEAQKEALSAHASHLKNANKEIKLKNKEILRQAKKLKAIDELKTKFLANISHEFRTPLTLILVPLEELILKTKSNTETNGMLSMMDRNARRLLQLINQLLDLSKIEHGNMELELQSQNITSYIQSLAQPFQAMAKKDNIDFQVICPKEELLVDFDADKLEKIIYNLISNAFKFTQSGGEIRICIEEIICPSSKMKEVFENDEQVRLVQITVSDSGQGIAAKHLPHIFDRFYQAEPSMARKSEGTGVGLALTKELVTLHQGKISVQSELGVGTCFKVQLPCSISKVPENIGMGAVLSKEKQDLIQVSAQVKENRLYAHDTTFSFQDNFGEPAMQPERLKLPLLLIVEDNEELRQQINRIFSGQFRVEEASNGNEGWTKALEKMPDIIISDVMMPEKDGLALCHLLKNDPTTSHIPTILLSARTGAEEAGLRIGADDYIIKPFNAKTLVLKVKNLLETRQKFREAICRELGVQESFSKVPELHAGICPRDIEFIEQSIEVALKHLNNPEFELEKLYRELGMSRSLVYNKLKSLTGLGPNEFIRRIRLNTASRLLLEGNAKVSEVMEEVGFNHRSYFIKCFKNEFGHLPSDHIKETDRSEKSVDEKHPEENINDKKSLAEKLIQENF